MKIINVQQGTQEWHDLRAQHDTASEAPAMAGVSKYQSRSELLQQKYSGEAPEVSEAQQRLFDRGHAAEASAREIAESIIGEELYPITGVSDKHPRLLASLDGATLLGDVIFEHKLWNEELAAAVRNGDLPEHYKVQMDQQLLVSGAERCLFMCSDGTSDNCVSCFHYPSESRFQALITGWDQFRADLKAYQPQARQVAPQGEAPAELPALQVELTGGVQASNLPEFKERALAMIASIKDTLTTDQDFADAGTAVKALMKGEGQLKASKDAALQQTASIAELFDTIDELAESMRQKRLHLEKLVQAEKANRRAEIQRQAEEAFAAWLAELDSPVTPIADLDVAGAMKGKKTIDTLKAAADDEVARAKVAATQEAHRLAKAELLLMGETRGYEFLFADRGQLLHKPIEDLEATIKARIAEHKEVEAKRQDAERERIRQEEEAKVRAAQQQDAERAQDAEAESHGATLKPASQVEQPETVTITRKEYEALLAAREKLDALEAAGVDNWSGYDDAMALLRAA